MNSDTGFLATGFFADLSTRMQKVLLLAPLFSIALATLCTNRAPVAVNPSVVANKETADHSGKLMSLFQLPEKDDNRLRFALVNNTSSSVFLAYDDSSDKEETFVPYGLKCKSEKEPSFQSVGPSFHFLPSLTALEPGREVVFVATRPLMRGECRMSVSFNTNAKAASLINERLMDLNSSEEEIVKKGWRTTGVSFLN